MKYLLLLGVAQARERQLSGSTGTLEWNILDQNGNPTSETGSAPCPLSDDAVHAAMCGRALSSGPSLVNCHGYDGNYTGCGSQSACSWEGSTQKCHSSSTVPGPSGDPCPAAGGFGVLSDGGEATLPCPVNQVGTRTATCSGGTTTVQSTCRPVGDFTDASKKQAAREALKSGMPDGGKKLKEATYATPADRKDKLIQAKTARRDYLKAQITVDTWKDLVIEDDNEFEGYTDQVLAKRQTRIDAGKSGKIRYRVAPATGLNCDFDTPDLTLTKEDGMDTVDPEGCVTIGVEVDASDPGVLEPGVIKMTKNGDKFDLECNDGASSPGLDVGKNFTCHGRVWDIGTATTDPNDFVGETIWVDDGDTGEPYYNFFTDAGCTDASTGKLTPDTQYMFKRCGDTVDHPFAVNSGSGWQPSGGITGEDSVIVTTDISGTVGWKCTNHPIMAGDFCVGAYDVCGRCGGDGTPTAGHWCADGVETEHGCGLGLGVKEGYYDGTDLVNLPTDSADICEVCAPSDQEYSNETDTSMCIQHTKCGEDLQPNANPFGANADHGCEPCAETHYKPVTVENPTNYAYCIPKVLGCTNPGKCNYDASATHDNGSCAVNDCAGTCGGSAVDLGCGCGSAGPSGCDNQCGSTKENDCAGDCGGSAVDLGCGCGSAGPVTNYDCSGACLNDTDNDGVCDEDESEDAVVCSAGLTATQYINNQCCQCPSS